MLKNWTDRVRYNVEFIKFCSKIRKGRHQKFVLLCHNIFNNIISEKEMAITRPFQMLIQY